MKDIITGTAITEAKKEAIKKWKEYVAASKAYKDPIYKDLQRVYNQAKNGKKIIDIFKVIQKGGVHPNGHPKLAVAKATAKKIKCIYSQNGHVRYLHDNRSWVQKEDVDLPGCLPTFKMQSTWQDIKLEAPVPICPPKLLPAKITDDYYILWEVDEWKMIPPTDPYLLRRITKNMFVVVAGWDLTEIEKAAMHGRMH